MFLIPAITIKDQHAARIMKTEDEGFDADLSDPITQAWSFANYGFPWINILDQDARAGNLQNNEQVIVTMMKTVKAKFQIAGGIRTIEDVEKWVDRGAERVVLGSIAIDDADMVRQAAKKFPNKVMLSISVLDNRVLTKKEGRQTKVRPLDLALRFDDAGLAGMIITDISRDGALMGVNVDQVADLAFALTTPIFAAGGVSCIADLQDVKEIEHLGVAGVICGRALYDGQLNPVDVLKFMEMAPDRVRLPIEDFGKDF